MEVVQKCQLCVIRENSNEFQQRRNHSIMVHSSFPQTHKVAHIGIFVLFKFESKTEKEINHSIIIQNNMTNVN